jgi:hypothetical protein
VYASAQIVPHMFATAQNLLRCGVMLETVKRLANGNCAERQRARRQGVGRLRRCFSGSDKKEGKQMNSFESITSARMWGVALLLAAFVAGCGSGDEILGRGTSAGGPGPAGAAPALGAAASFAGLAGGGAGMTNQGISTVITGAQGQPVSIGTTAASTTVTGFHDTSVAYTPPPAKVEPHRDSRPPRTDAPIDKFDGPDAAMIRPGKARTKTIKV